MKQNTIHVFMIFIAFLFRFQFIYFFSLHNLVFGICNLCVFVSHCALILSCFFISWKARECRRYSVRVLCFVQLLSKNSFLCCSFSCVAVRCDIHHGHGNWHSICLVQKFPHTHRHPTSSFSANFSNEFRESKTMDNYGKLWKLMGNSVKFSTPKK